MKIVFAVLLLATLGACAEAPRAWVFTQQSPTQTTAVPVYGR